MDDKQLDRVENMCTEIFKILNGKDGLVTKTELNEKAIEVNEKAIAWVKKTFVTTLFVIFLGLCVKEVWL